MAIGGCDSAAFILGLMDDAIAGRLLLYLMRRFAGGEDENLEEWPTFKRS